MHLYSINHDINVFIIRTSDTQSRVKQYRNTTIQTKLQYKQIDVMSNDNTW